jgi:methionine-rich copper-binding protein CopC/putative copper export protein
VHQRRYFTLLLIFMLSLSILLVYDWWPTPSRASVALAHAYVIGSDPVDGSTVSSAPAVVRIFFNEAIGPASIAHVFAPDGQVVDAAPSSISRTNPRELDTPLASPDSLPQGGYTARWTALSDDDGHTTHGVIGFNVGQSNVGLPGETILGPSTSNILPQLDLFGVLSVAWDWLVMLALTFWVGILVMEGLVLTRHAGRKEQTSETETAQPLEQGSDLLTQDRKQSLPLQWLMLTALLVGEIITLILRTTVLTQTLGGSGINLLVLRQLVVETNYGHLWLTRVTLIVFALGLLWWTTRRQNSKRITLSRNQSGSRFSQLRRQVAQEQSAELLIDVDDDNGRGNPAEEKGISSNERPAVSADKGLLPVAPRFIEGVNQVPDEVSGQTSTSLVRSLASVISSAKAPVNIAVSLADNRGGAGIWLTVVWLVLAGLILLTIALTSDAAQLAQPHTSAVVLDWLYLVVQSVWFGALAYLGYVLLPLLLIEEPNRYAGTLTLLLRRLTSPTLGTLGVLFVSGLFLSESSLSSVQQLFTDPYGRALLVKIVLIVLMIMFSVYGLFAIRPKLARQTALLTVVDAELPARRTRQSALERTAHRLGQTLKLQSWLGAGALLCAALMTFYAPPIVFPANSYAVSTSAASPSSAAINAQTQKVGNLSVTLEVLPGRVDYANTVVVTIDDNQGNPVTDAQVQLSTNMELMDMGTAHANVKGGNPTYIATFNKDAAFSMLGAWDITVRIQRPNQTVVQALFKVTLTT